MEKKISYIETTLTYFLRDAADVNETLKTLSNAFIQKSTIEIHIYKSAIGFIKPLFNNSIINRSLVRLHFYTHWIDYTKLFASCIVTHSTFQIIKHTQRGSKKIISSKTPQEAIKYLTKKRRRKSAGIIVICLSIILSAFFSSDILTFSTLQFTVFFILIAVLAVAIVLYLFSLFEK